MLKSTLLQPDILAALGRAGHGSKVLIADGNYPFATTLGPNAELVCLNLSPGIVSVTEVLAALVTAVPIEQAAVMQYLTEGPYALDADPPIWAEFGTILRRVGFAEPLVPSERFAFYEAACSPEVCLTIATADQRIYANVLLTVGVVMPRPVADDEAA